MKLAIFTLVEHKKYQGKYYGYAPYVREMDLWNSHFEEVFVVAPLSKAEDVNSIDSAYQHLNLKLIAVPVFNIKSIESCIKLIFLLPSLIFKIVRVMQQADHLHFRSPSNIAAIASVIQVFFPKKKKTMRYTGNWDPNSKQPMGYRFQKFMFSNTLFTKNMTALVYGNWPKTSKYIKPFFAATFHNNEKETFLYRDYHTTLKLVFIGALVPGKRPLLAVKIVERLRKEGIDCTLEVFGEGPLKEELEQYTLENKIETSIFMYGNKPKEVIKKALKQSHFTILPSQSEGWPKAIAEGMFFGSIPISTKISCVDWMLGYGKRGVLIEPNVESATQKILRVLNHEDLNEMAKAAQNWSQEYTVEKQEKEIKKFLNL